MPDLKLAHRLRRWADIKSTLVERLVIFVKYFSYVYCIFQFVS